MSTENVTSGLVQPAAALLAHWQRSPPVDQARDRRLPEILRLWDESTDKMNALWPLVPPERFGQTMTAFGQYPGLVHDLVLYAIDNEVHHRGQGYVYLRALSIEPPPFYDRQ